MPDHQKDTLLFQVTKNRTIITPHQEIQKHTARFRDFLLYGKKKGALEYAMTHGLWGHALFLASKMDERSYSQVMLRFANGLVVNDPLQTLYQLMSGRQPIAVKECADVNWGDWRPHLAMILSNAGGKNEGLKSIMTLGDTLTEKGQLWAGQFCYLMANKEFGGWTNRNAFKLVLIGADKAALNFQQFATNEAIQITEIFEYVQKLSNEEYVLSSFLYFKFLYAVRLLDYGMSSEALHYLEELSLALVKTPLESLDQDLRDQIPNIIYLADKLKYLDPMYTTQQGEISDMDDPAWLTILRTTIESGSLPSQSMDQTNSTQDPQQPWQGTDDEGRVFCYDPGTNSYYYPTVPQEIAQESAQPEVQPDLGSLAQGEAKEHSPIQDPVTPEQDPLMNQPVEQKPESRRESESSLAQNVPMVPMGSVPMGSVPMMPMPPMVPPTPGRKLSADLQPPSMPTPPSLPPAMQPPLPPAPSPAKKPEPVQTPPVPAPAQKKQPTAKDGKKDSKGSNTPGLFGRLLGKIGVLPPNQMHLPDEKDSTILWDEDKKRWVDKNAPEDEDSAAYSAPPSDLDLSRTNSSANFEQTSGPPGAAPPMAGTAGGLMPPPGGANKFAGGLGKKRGALGRVDVFKNSQSSPALSSSMMPPPGDLFAPPPVMNTPATSPVGDNEPLAPEQMAPVAPVAPGATTPEGGPVFFNPNAYGAPAPSTRRNKYA